MKTTLSNNKTDCSVINFSMNLNGLAKENKKTPILIRSIVCIALARAREKPLLLFFLDQIMQNKPIYFDQILIF